jgi:hypothetical protein
MKTSVTFVSNGGEQSDARFYILEATPAEVEYAIRVLKRAPGIKPWQAAILGRYKVVGWGSLHEWTDSAWGVERMTLTTFSFELCAAVSLYEPTSDKPKSGS